MTTDSLQPLMDALWLAWPRADSTSLTTVADQLLRGQSATLGTSTAALTFGQGNRFDHATVTIGTIAGGNSTNLTINVPQPINPQAAILQQLLYHHESATIFANRLDTFVGREAEIAEIRARIAQVMPAGGYVTITAQAGEAPGALPKSGYVFTFRNDSVTLVAWRDLDQSGLGGNELDDRFGWAITISDIDTQWCPGCGYWGAW